jgi:aquaporin Z
VGGRLRAAAVAAATVGGVLFAWPLSGAALNPARAFGPALVSGTWSAWWVGWVGPLAAAALAALAVRALAPEDPGPA